MDKNFKNNLSYNQSILKNTQIDKIDVNGTRIAQFLGMPLIIDEVHNKPSLLLAAPALTISNEFRMTSEKNVSGLNSNINRFKFQPNFNALHFKKLNWNVAVKHHNNFEYKLIYQPQIRDGFGITINF